MFKKTKNNIFSITLLLMLLMTFVTPVTTNAITEDETIENSSPQQEGVTEAIYSYEDAIKETIYVESTLDSDQDGNPDRSCRYYSSPKNR